MVILVMVLKSLINIFVLLLVITIYIIMGPSFLEGGPIMC